MKIEFVEPKLPSWLAWILAAVPLALSLAMGGASSYLRVREDARRAQLEAAQRAALAKPAAAAVHRAAPPYQAEALAAIKRAGLPEADALSELEHVEVAGIQLRSIEVNPALSVVVVELDATSDAALGDYLDQLNAGDSPRKWHIRKLASLAGDGHPLPPASGANGQVIEGHSVSISREL